MHSSVMEFFMLNANLEEFKGKRVLEVGSRDVNGSVRPFTESKLKPLYYLGVDIIPGPRVDLVIKAEDLLKLFLPGTFDVVICLETLEHIEDWNKALANMKALLVKGGVIFLTTRSEPFAKHDWPGDYWRFTLEDLSKAFSDFEILVLKKDPLFPGVFLKARKPI